MEIWKELILALVLSSLLAALAGVQKALTPKALFLAWSCSLIITFCGGVVSFAILAATFVFTVVAGKIKKSRRAVEKKVNAKSGSRDAMQIFCNVGTGTILLLLSCLLEQPQLKLAYVAVMAASLADSLASELGILSKADPVDICTMKKTQRGLSGGVTLWGFVSSLLGAALIAAVYAIGTPNWKQILFITACGFGGALLDSILGSLLQVKYRCPVCQMMTERKEHCGKSTEKIKGYEKITNDTVNLICNVSVGVLAAVLLLIGG